MSSNIIVMRFQYEQGRSNRVSRYDVFDGRGVGDGSVRRPKVWLTGLAICESWTSYGQLPGVLDLGGCVFERRTVTD